MLSSTICLSAGFIIAVALDIYLVRGWNRYLRIRDASQKKRRAKPVSQRELFKSAFQLDFIAKIPVKFHVFKPGSWPLTEPFVRAAEPAFAIALTGVGIALLRGQIWLGGGVFLILGLASMAFSQYRLQKAPLTAGELKELQPILPSTILWITAFGLVLISTVFVADNIVNSETNRAAAILWICGMVCAALAVAIPEIRKHKNDARKSLFERIRNHQRELIIATGILGLALLVRTIDLSMHPYPWSGDESSIGVEAGRILNGEITNFFDSGWSSQSNWSFVPTAAAEILFGQNILAVRLVSALEGVLAVLFTYLFGRTLFGPEIGLLAGVFLASLPYNVHFSRIGVNNIVDSLASALLFWLIAKSIKTEDLRFYFGAGLLAGLSIYTYAGTRLVAILGGCALLYVIVRQRKFLKAHVKHLLTFGAAAVLSAAPQAAYFARHQDIFLGRFGQEGIFLNGWLSHQIITTDRSAVAIIWEQFSRVTTTFIATPAQGGFMNSPNPYLSFLTSVLLLAGMGYAIANVGKIESFIILLWFWVPIILGGVLTTPPENTRLLMTTPAVSLLIAIGLCQSVKYLEKTQVLPGRITLWVVFGIVCVTTFQNIRFYMFEYQSNYYFEDANGEFAMETALMARELGPDYHIFDLGSPRIFTGFPTIPFVDPKNPRTDLDSASVAALQIKPGEKAVFFAIPDNARLLTEIQQKYPGGRSGNVYRKPNPAEILFEYYILTP